MPNVLQYVVFDSSHRLLLNGFAVSESLFVLATTGSANVAQATESCTSIADIACSTKDFGLLCAAVKAAGLGDALSSGTYTVFAPTDKAFGNLPNGTVQALLADVPSLTNVLLFHAVADKTVYSSDLHCTETVEMANGVDSRTVCKGGKIYQKGGGNSRDAMPEIVTADIKACNGVVHVVSEVMLPPKIFVKDDKPECSTIAEIACTTPGFSTLCAAVKAAGLTEALTSDTYTVFAPTDEAFGKLPNGTVASLLKDIPALTEILLFHAVADQAVYAKDLHCTGKIAMANGDNSRTVCRSNKIYQKGAGNSRSALPEIVTADLKACNGVVHVVSQVLLP